MFKETRLKYRRVPIVALGVIPLSFVCLLLGGGGHAPLAFYMPFALLYGPLAVLGFYIGGTDTTSGDIARLLYSFFSPYPLYVTYGLIFVFLSSQKPSYLWRWLFVGGVLAIHIFSAFTFLRLGGLAR